MTKEFKLIEKEVGIRIEDGVMPFFPLKDVREFVKLLKEVLVGKDIKPKKFVEIMNEIDKLSGFEK